MTCCIFRVEDKRTWTLQRPPNRTPTPTHNKSNCSVQGAWQQNKTPWNQHLLQLSTRVQLNPETLGPSFTPKSWPATAWPPDFTFTESLVQNKQSTEKECPHRSLVKTIGKKCWRAMSLPTLLICRARASVHGQGRQAWRWGSHCAEPGMSAGNGAPAPSASCTGCRVLQSRILEQCCRSHSASLPHPHCNDTMGKC